MSHIHFPDGILPLWLWVAGFVIVFLYLVAFGYYIKKSSNLNKLPLIGVFAALMLIAMTIHIIPIGYHINLAVLTGIIIGPIFAPLAIFIVNILLAFLGHGGVTTIGLNTIVISIEAIVGFLGFSVLKSKIKNIFVVTFISTVIALLVSTCSSIGIVYLGTNSIESLMHKHDHKHEDSKILHSVLLEKFFGNNDQQAGSEHKDEHEVSEIGHDRELNQEKAPQKGKFDLTRFALIILGLGFIGWILEGLITAFIVNYLNKIKPDLLEK